MKDDMLRTYLRYVSYAEVLRAMAAESDHRQARDVMTTAADGYDQMAIWLLSVLQSKAALEK